MAVVKGVPENSSVVIPRLICRDPAAAIEFCVHTFNGVVVTQRPGPDGRTVHALLTIGPAMLMIEGVEYSPCGFCHNLYPIEEQCWSYDLQAWVCYEHILFFRRDR